MKIETILVPIDFSDVTPKVLEVARFLATALKSKVVLLHVALPEPDFVGFEAGPQSVRTDMARVFQGEHRRLDDLKSSFEDLEVLALQLQGPTIEKILVEQERQQAGMIIVGSHGHGALYNLLAGSVTSGLLKSAPCPVLVVPSAPKAN